MRPVGVLVGVVEAVTERAAWAAARREAPVAGEEWAQVPGTLVVAWEVAKAAQMAESVARETL